MHCEDTAKGRRLCWDGDEAELRKVFLDALLSDGGAKSLVQAFVRVVGGAEMRHADVWKSLREKAIEQGSITPNEQLVYDFATDDFRVVPPTTSASSALSLAAALDVAKARAVKALDFELAASLRDRAKRARLDAEVCKEKEKAKAEEAESPVEAEPSVEDGSNPKEG